MRPTTVYSVNFCIFIFSVVFFGSYHSSYVIPFFYYVIFVSTGRYSSFYMSFPHSPRGLIQVHYFYFYSPCESSQVIHRLIAIRVCFMNFILYIMESRSGFPVPRGACMLRYYSFFHNRSRCVYSTKPSTRVQMRSFQGSYVTFRFYFRPLLRDFPYNFYFLSVFRVVRNGFFLVSIYITGHCVVHTFSFNFHQPLGRYRIRFSISSLYQCPLRQMRYYH